MGVPQTYPNIAPHTASKIQGSEKGREAPERLKASGVSAYRGSSVLIGGLRWKRHSEHHGQPAQVEINLEKTQRTRSEERWKKNWKKTKTKNLATWHITDWTKIKNLFRHHALSDMRRQRILWAMSGICISWYWPSVSCWLCWHWHEGCLIAVKLTSSALLSPQLPATSRWLSWPVWEGSRSRLKPTRCKGWVLCLRQMSATHLNLETKLAV